MNKQIIFLDIDGTLTEPGKNVPPASALEAIKKARADGHKVVLCTGRNYDMLSPLLVYPFDGVIASSGGYIEVEGKPIYDCAMTPEQKERSMKTLEELGIFRTVECMEGSFTDDGFKEFLREHASEGGNSELLRWREQIEASLNIKSMKEYKGQPIYKIVMMGTNLDSFLKAKELLSDEFSIVIQDVNAAGICNGELVIPNYDKGQAVLRVCEYLHHDPKDTIGFGDSMNDLEMIETVGLSVCMANGSEELKKRSDKICPAVTDDGLAKAFEELLN